MSIKLAAISGVILVALTALAACGGGENVGFPAGSETTPAEVSIEVSLFEKLLGVIPDTPNTRKSVMINDYAAVRAVFGIPLPGPEAGEPAIQEYIIGILGPATMAHLTQGPFITGISGEAMGNPRREYLAFDSRNVDQSVEAGIGPFILEVAWGRFDPDATGRALASCSECPPPDIVTHNDVSFYSWGGDGQGSLRERHGPPAFDHLGRGGRISVSSEYVYRTVETPGMKALIDSRAGDGQSLADVEEFRLLGRAMSSLGAYAAFFSNQTHKVTTVPDDRSIIVTAPDLHQKLIAEIGDSSLLLPYLAFSTGVGRDGTGRYMALALVHGDAESAEENGRRLEKRVRGNPELKAWMDGLEEYTSRVEGRVLSVMLRGDGPASKWKSLSLTITPLIPHE